MGTPVTIAVLANDGDVDGGPLAGGAITPASNGAVVFLIVADTVTLQATMPDEKKPKK